MLINNYDFFVDIINYSSITKLFISHSYFGIKSNDERLIDNKIDTTLLCYVSQQKGIIKYIEKDKINKEHINKWKVITTRYAFDANSGFGNMFIGKPNEICNKSYIFFQVETEEEAKSLLSYMKCKLPNYMLSLQKTTPFISKI